MTEIRYKDVSPYAKSYATFASADKQPFVDLSQLKLEGLSYTKYATLEQDFIVLDGTFENFPDDTENITFGYWSESMSDENGDFTNFPVLQVDLSQYISSLGISLQFNTETNDYCNDLTIEWYQDSTLLDTQDFAPDNVSFYCANRIENYNKLIITFKSTNNPYRYIKLQDLMFGRVRSFSDEQLVTVSLIEEMSPISEEISINTLNFTFFDRQEDYLFQTAQPIEIRFNNAFYGLFFLEKATRKSESKYEVGTVDYLGMLDKVPFDETTYTNATVATVINDIIGTIPYELEDSLQSVTISGTIQKGTCREALMQVVFAIRAVVDTSRDNKIKIFTLNDNIVSTIEQNDIYTGIQLTHEEEVTGIRVKKNNDSYVTKKNPVVNASATENVLEYEGACIDNSNAQAIVNMLYDYYVTNKNDKTNLKFEVKNNEQVGDIIQFDGDWLGDELLGRIVSMKYGLNSNKVVAEVEVKNLEAINE